MPLRLRLLSFVLPLLALAGCADSAAPPDGDAADDVPHIVFVTGDEEYRSEESMPMLARILERDYGFRTTVRFALDSAGIVDPNRLDHIPGLDVLDDADLMVLFTRFRALPDSQLVHILDYAASGRPMVGFRTATHAFLYKDDPDREYLNEDWPRQVFGQQWITHHGHFEDGNAPLTDVTLVADAAGHPILRGVTPFRAYSWLYHVDGGDYELYGDSSPLLRGEALRSNHEEAGRLDEFPLTNPVAWTKTYTATSGETARVFFTTLGHPYDFRQPEMRTLALNGILWALGREDQIPLEGADPTTVGPFEPNNSGFGDKYKPNMRPEDF